MTATEILRDWLKKHKYDGLAGDQCGCDLDDLMPCGQSPDGCVPAIQEECDGNRDCDCEHAGTHYRSTEICEHQFPKSRCQECLAST